MNIVKPSIMSRRGFLQGILGITATLILPGRKIVASLTISEVLTKPGLESAALDAMNEFTRAKLREDGFYRRILPPLPIQNDMLDCSVPMPLVRGGWRNGVFVVQARRPKLGEFELEDIRI